MTPELQKPDAAPKTPRVIPLTQEEQTMAAMTAINMILAALFPLFATLIRTCVGL